MDCIFCKIISGEIPSNKVYEDDKVVAFYDLEPQTPVHVLIVPKVHVESVLGIDETNSEAVAHVFEVAAKLAVQLGIAEEGFRVVTNTGENAGQTVKHIHFHLLGGRKLGREA